MTGVHFELFPGEVHTLMGENGAVFYSIVDEKLQIASKQTADFHCT
mgnify:CR=1 FL=1